MHSSRNCIHGHQWQADVDSQSDVCPVCGGAAETLSIMVDSSLDHLAPIPMPTAVPNPGAAALKKRAEDALPQVPGFEILEKLGQGGMGVVYKARQVQLKREVALKFIRPHALADADTVRRFQAEAQAVATLRHPNIVQLFELGEYQGQPFQALEFVEGGSLAQKLARHPLPVAEAATMLHALVQGMNAAHAAGIIHRDLKPANVLLQLAAGSTQQAADSKPSKPTVDSRSRLGTSISAQAAIVPKISDFGLAKQIDADDSNTQTGAIIGTPSYMAPEQAAGQRQLTASVDIYALGAILYEMLVGKPPFHGATPLETLEQVRRQDPIAPRVIRPDVPRDLETICLKCLEKEPAKRYESAEALAEDLRRFCAGEPIIARPIGVLARGVKWTRRNRMLSALYGVIVITSVLICAILAVSYQQVSDSNDELKKKNKAYDVQNTELAVSNNNLEKALGKSDRLQKKSELLAYLRSIPLAYHEFLDYNVVGALSILKECPPHLRHWEWHYLIAMEPVPKRVYQTNCRKAVFSPDSQKLILIPGRGPLQVMNVADGTTESRAITKLTDVIDLAFCSDGAHLAIVRKTQAFKGEALLWNWKEDKLMERVPLDQAKLFAEPSAIALASDGRTFAVTSTRLIVAVGKFDGKTSFQNTTVNGFLTTLSFAGDARRLLGSSPTGKTFVWNAFPEDRVEYASMFSQLLPPAHVFALGAADLDLVLTPLTTKNPPVLLRAHRQRIAGLAISADGKTAASHALDKSIITWDLEKRSPLRIIRPTSTRKVDGIALSPDGSLVVRIVDPGTLELWDARQSPDETRQTSDVKLRSLPGPHRRYYAFSEGDAHLAIWDTAQAKITAEFKTKFPVTDVAFSADESIAAIANTEWLASAGVGKKIVKLVRPSDGAILATLDAHAGHHVSLFFGPHSDVLLTVGHDGKAKLWDVKTGELKQTFDHEKQWIQSGAISPDGRHAVTCVHDQTVRLFNRANGKLLHQWQAPGKTGAHCARFDPTGNKLAVGFNDGAIRLWSLANPEQATELIGHTALVTDLSWSSDGKRLASMGNDAYIRVWEPELALEILKIPLGPGAGAGRLQFGKDDRFLSAFWNAPVYGTAVTWPATSPVIMPMRKSTGRIEWRPQERSPPSAGWCLRRGSPASLLLLQEDRPLTSNSGRCPDRTDGTTLSRKVKRTWRSGAISPDGRHAVTCVHDQTVRLFNLASGKLFAPMAGTRQDGSSLREFRPYRQ